MDGKPEGIGWRNKFVDLIVVVAGIYIAFALNNWQEDKRKETLQKQYLTSLRDDLVKDQKIVDDDLVALLRQTEKTKKLSAYALGATYSKDSLYHYLTGILSVTTFYPNNYTFQSIIHSGDLTHFTDVEFIRALTELYNGTYMTMKEIDRIQLDSFQEHIVGRIVAGLPYDDKYLHSESFKGLVGTVQSFNEQKIKLHQDAKESIRKLLEQVNGRISE